MIPLLLGGEMPHWSDTDPAGGAALATLAAAARGHTLIVGPHSFPLIDAVQSRQVTVLVRGVPDAEALAARYASRAGFEVCCGSVAKLAAVPAYDTVLALDGLDRTGTTESDGLTWADGLAALLAVLRPGGQLLLGCENPAGLHRLLALSEEPGSGDWAAGDRGAPAGLPQLRERIVGAGMSVLRDYAAYPSPRSPRLLASSAALADRSLHGFFSGALRRAGTPEGPVLADPRPVAVQMLNSDLAADLAPGWFVLAAKGGQATLPEVVLATESGPIHHLNRTSQGWIQQATNPDAPSPVPTGRNLLDAPSPVPIGWNLLDALLDAARGRDLPALRALLTAWQGGELAGIDADEIVVDGDGRLHDLGLGESQDPGPALRHFIEAAPGDLAELIEAMAGIEAAAGGAAIRPGVEAFREVAAAHDRLARELGEARTTINWYEERLAARDTELARAYRIIALLKGTVPGRAATAVRGALRTGKKAARTALHQIRKS
ncbi:hypothetical protein FB565_000941 [Actinoplanes lutulentus]|uniref:Methyltransferase family protein n=1 Tax=Actinoplanes lutulentus TaxID=1287878 RepID=A0A327ZMM0_9ACTN|nr:hypothetical protein [Actinoplanes lutulentus]MBB2941237.1 hypothetical protein [Actinoplanes lutulentus]RAK43546.1 hypothetical protein B0I29_101677 [Actinoplanes lutulentus]